MTKGESRCVAMRMDRALGSAMPVPTHGLRTICHRPNARSPRSHRRASASAVRLASTPGSVRQHGDAHEEEAAEAAHRSGPANPLARALGSERAAPAYAGIVAQVAARQWLARREAGQIDHARGPRAGSIDKSQRRKSLIAAPRSNRTTVCSAPRAPRGSRSSRSGRLRDGTRRSSIGAALGSRLPSRRSIYWWGNGARATWEPRS